MTHEELIGSLKKLRLPAMADQYVETARISEKKKNTYEQYLSILTQVELNEKHRLRVMRFLKEAKLPKLRTIEGYDFIDRKGVSAPQMNRLAEGEFIRKAGNIVFFGDIGVGKSHLALALTRLLCQKGFRCLFISTQELVEQLLEAKKDLTLNALFKKLDRFDLLTVDELGYIAQTQQGADLFFQLISQRYERKSLMITTNLTYSEWDKVFLNPITTAAAVDRIIHTCETFNVQGPSWRSESAQKKNKKK